MVWGTVVILIVLGLYLGFGSYTKKSTATGILTPTAGLIRINSSVSGVIIERRVQEGQAVRKGDVLFIVADERAFFAPDRSTASSSTRVSGPVGSQGLGSGAGESGRVADAVDASLAKRALMLQSERTQTEIVARQALSSTETEIRQFEAELEGARQELKMINSRVNAASAQMLQYGKLAEKSYMSAAALAQKNDELTALQLSHANATRGVAGLERQLSTLKGTRDQTPARLALAIAGLAQREAALSQEVVEVRARGQTAIVAPINGTMTGMLAEPGSTVSTQSLATLVPEGSDLQAFLYVPSRSIGFVKPGQPVRLRYQAYPYQKFGQYQGAVKQVSRAQIGQDQLPEVMPTGTREGLYRIVVSLDQQHVTTYGERQKLIPGMIVEADILQDKRSLVEWIFEPLLGWRRKF